MGKIRDYLFTILWFIWPLSTIFFWACSLASVPVFLQRAAAGALPLIETQRLGGLSAAETAAEGAAAWGVSAGTWSWINALASGLGFLVFTVVAVFIWWRVRSGFGLLTAYVLLQIGLMGMNAVVFGAALSLLITTVWNLSLFIFPFFFLWMFLFPDGRAVPRWLLWIVVPLLVLTIAGVAIDIAAEWLDEGTVLSPTFAGLAFMSVIVIYSLVFLVVGAQIYRFARVSGAAERAQTKWFVAALFFALVPLFFFDLFAGIQAELLGLTMMALPIGIGISILRYRLWDIDLIIRKTLIYGLSTAVLVAVYFTLVVLAQAAFVALTGQQSPLAIVISTLVIAVLFNPLRRRLQSVMDRHFYRRKYDAGQILAQFARRARDEVELEALTAGLNRSVQETLQPEFMSLWLVPETTAGKEPVKSQ